jgi:hypothetical protein
MQDDMERARMSDLQNKMDLEKARLQTNQPQQMNDVQSKYVQDRAAMNREYSRGFRDDFR